MSTLVNLSNSPLFSNIDPPEGLVNELTDSTDLGVLPLAVEPNAECIVNVTDFDETNLTDIENRVDDKIQDIEDNDPYKLTYDNTVMMESSSQEDFALHSPDSLSNQCLYDDYGGHYSPAGRGYPHGGYMGQNTDTTEPVSPQSSIDASNSLMGEPLADIGNSSIREGISDISNSLIWESMADTASPLISEPIVGMSNENIDRDSNCTTTTCQQQPIVDQELQPITASDQNVPPSVEAGDIVPMNEISSSCSENSVCPSTDSSPLSPICSQPVAQTASIIQPTDSCGERMDMLLPDNALFVYETLAANCEVEMRSPHRRISLSDSDDSIIETDCVHEPLLNKRASYASTSSHSSRKTLTNGQGSDLDDRSSINSYEHKVMLLDEDIGQSSKVNGVTMDLTEGHSFGETYFV
jgi:hypothetical protein